MCQEHHPSVERQIIFVLYRSDVVSQDQAGQRLVAFEVSKSDAYVPSEKLGVALLGVDGGGFVQRSETPGYFDVTPGEVGVRVSLFMRVEAYSQILTLAWIVAAWLGHLPL
jgi:hypothetical protein